MKVSKSWLKELIDLKVPVEEVEELLPRRTIAIKEFAPDYFELDMKGYNRADLLSLHGVAYEVAAITGSIVKFGEPTTEDFIWHGQNLPEVKVEVKNTALAPLYCLAKIEGLKVEKSPKEWVKKLEESGIRTVNNVADVTNLVMVEYGQPLHSFDAAAVSDEAIIVRTAKDEEELVTLDGKKRTLQSSDLLIADPEKPLGLAGVMGGKNSEVTSSTHTIILEAAIFDPFTLRKTSTRLGLASEASKRFQHGLTKKRLLQALDAAVRMYQNLGGKLTAVSIIGNHPDIIKKITLTQNKINSLTGLDIKPERVEDFLAKLYFTVERIREGEWLVAPPYFRLDIALEEDVIEEIARLYGYEKIPAQPLSSEIPPEIDQRLFHLSYDLKIKLADLGMAEIQTYSFYSTAILNNLKLLPDKLIRIANPMSKETEYLRKELWPNLLETTVKNLKSQPEIAFFEVGKVYVPKVNDLPEEHYRLGMALSTTGTTSIQELYMIFLKMAEALGLKFKTAEFKRDKKEEELFHPTRLAKLMYKDKEVGLIGEVHPRITNRFGSERRVAVLEINIDPLVKDA